MLGLTELRSELFDTLKDLFLVSFHRFSSVADGIWKLILHANAEEC